MSATNIRERIHAIIKRNKECRNDKRKLVANFLQSEMKEMNLNQQHVSYFEFLKMYASGKFTEIESITRIHREVIRELDEAEGKTHDEKKGDQQKVKQDLQSMPKFIECLNCGRKNFVNFRTCEKCKHDLKP